MWKILYRYMYLNSCLVHVSYHNISTGNSFCSVVWLCLFLFFNTYNIHWIKKSINYKCQWKETYHDAISIRTKLRRVFIQFVSVLCNEKKVVISRIRITLVSYSMWGFFCLLLLTNLSHPFPSDFPWLRIICQLTE